MSAIFPLDDLLECKWRNISFPIINMQTFFSHDVVEHKFPNVDGAILEEMGRNPIIVSGTIPFFNSITPSKNEKWIAGDLYPNHYTRFILACRDGETGIFQHPFLGQFDAKIVSFNSKLQANVRGGEYVDVTWKETITLSNQEALDEGLLLSNMKARAKQLDTAIAHLLVINPKTLFPFLYKDNVTFDGLVGSFISLLDQGNLAVQQLAAKAQRVLYYCNKVISALQQANMVLTSSINSLVYSVANSILLLKKFWDWNQYQYTTNNGGIINPTAPTSRYSSNSSVYQSINTRKKNTYKTTSITTLSQLASQLNNSIGDLIQLNPNSLGLPFIPSQTVIVYYIGN